LFLRSKHKVITKNKVLVSVKEIKHTMGTHPPRK